MVEPRGRATVLPLLTTDHWPLTTRPATRRAALLAPVGALGAALLGACADPPAALKRRPVALWLAMPSDLPTREQQAWEGAARQASLQSGGVFHVEPFYVPAAWTGSTAADALSRQHVVEAALLGEPTGAGPRRPPADLLLLRTSFPWSTDPLATAAAADALPRLVARRLALPLDQFARLDLRSGASPKTYEWARDALRFQGKLVALPGAVSLLAPVLDRRALEFAGLDLPPATWTWPECLALSERLIRSEGGRTVQLGFCDPGTFPLPLLVWQAGGDVLDRAQRVPLLEEPAAVGALAFYRSLTRGQRVAAPPASATWQVSSDRMAYGGGKAPETRAAMAFVRVTSGWPPALAPGSGGKPALRLVEYPGAVNGRAVSFGAVDSVLVVGGRSAQPHLAYQALRAMLDLLRPEDGVPFTGQRHSSDAIARALKPSVTQDEVALLAQWLENARAVPMEWGGDALRVLETEVRLPLARGERSATDAARVASRQLERALR